VSVRCQNVPTPAFAHDHHDTLRNNATIAAATGRIALIPLTASGDGNFLFESHCRVPTPNDGHCFYVHLHLSNFCNRHCAVRYQHRSSIYVWRRVRRPGALLSESMTLPVQNNVRSSRRPGELGAELREGVGGVVAIFVVVDRVSVRVVDDERVASDVVDAAFFIGEIVGTRALCHAVEFGVDILP
jgi:hypothetical protein